MKKKFNSSQILKSSEDCNSAKVVEKLFYRHSEPKAKNPKKAGTVMPDLIGYLSRIKKEAAEVAFGAASQAPCLGSRLLSCPRMTRKVLSFLRLRGAGKKQKESSLILRKAKFQAIFEFVLPLASKGTEGIKYNLNFLRIGRSLEKFFKKNFRDDSFCFGFAKVTALALILALITISESRAECKANICYDSWNPGVADNCGDGCTYSYDNGKLTVTATKPDAVIPEGMFTHSYYEEGVFPKISQIEIAGEFKTIGQHAFLDNRTTISGKGGVLYTNGIDHNAFGNNNTLTGTIIVSDKQTTLGEGPWYATNLNATVILPPTLRSISGRAVYGLHLGKNAKIYCGAENCEELFKNVDCDAIGKQDSTRCKNNLETLLTSGKLLAYPDGCTKMGASGCTKCKNENFKLNDGECDRLRYTPAEAAKVLKDDNNSVTITFKK